MIRFARPLPLFVLLAAVLCLLAMLRGIDHDESQYVAAARLTANGLLPYRDYAYLQTPLQPFVFAPVAWLFDSVGWNWPALRIVNALLGAVAVAATWRAMREAGAGERTATACAALFAACDILLFSAGTARNDALPAALFALALGPMLRAERGQGTRVTALLAGLLLAAAAAAKISYALPAAAYGVYALWVRRHRPLWVAIGAIPALALVGGLAWLAPEGFVFGTLTFPAQAPAEYYAATDRLWKLSLWAKALDAAKFLALGPALLALIVVMRHRAVRRPDLLESLVITGLVAALLPAPTWRQYLLPVLPPLFVLLALRWQDRPPTRGWQIAAGVFVLAGLAPSAVAITAGTGLSVARDETRGMAAISPDGDVATLSPQFLADRLRPDPRFATGPFYFRSSGLLDAAAERRLHLVSKGRIGAALADHAPDFILVGGESKWTSGDDRLDAVLEVWAIGNRWQPVYRSARFRLYAPPQAATATRALPSISSR